MSGPFGRELPAERPTTPDQAYGVPTEGGTMIDWAGCVERLRTAEAYWLSTTRPDGSPHVVPVWVAPSTADRTPRSGPRWRRP